MKNRNYEKKDFVDTALTVVGIGLFGTIFLATCYNIYQDKLKPIISNNNNTSNIEKIVEFENVSQKQSRAYIISEKEISKYLRK